MKCLTYRIEEKKYGTYFLSSRTFYLRPWRCGTTRWGDIMGAGEASAEQMRDFLGQKNERALTDFSNIAESYIEYANKEGVNHDVAFCQMCVD
ncbi:hypothetical protein E1H12_02230 [Geitlerinema sp. P-1104]|nr:hypothetical protein [Geitlerinema sp. P-1104]